MKKMMLLVIAAILLLSVSCAACRAETDVQSGENASTTVPTQSVAETPGQTVPSDHGWGMGVEDFDDGDQETESAKPTGTEPDEAEPAETEPDETEPAETEPAETEPAETEPVETEPAETESNEFDWGMGGEDF